MKTYYRIIFVITAACFFSEYAYSQSTFSVAGQGVPSWAANVLQGTPSINGTPNQSYTSDSVYVYSSDGQIYVNTPQPQRVWVYSILGVLIDTQELSAGTTQLQLFDRGVFLVKIGSIVRKVVI